MVGQQVKLPHMGALVCLVTLVLFLNVGPMVSEFRVLEDISVAAAAAAASQMRANSGRDS